MIHIIKNNYVPPKPKEPELDNSQRYQRVCPYCSSIFTFQQSDVEWVEGGLMGDWQNLTCPCCGKDIEPYTYENGEISNAI